VDEEVIAYKSIAQGAASQLLNGWPTQALFACVGNNLSNLGAPCLAFETWEQVLYQGTALAVPQSEQNQRGF
jgi:hypothetical protein